MNTLKALLWKDWRLARSILIATGALYVTPIIIGGVWLAIPSNDERPQGMSEWLGGLAQGLIMGLFVTFLASPLYGAVMFARERRDRTAELVGAMPLRRGPIVLSKATVLAVLTSLPWLITAAAVGTIWMVISSAFDGDPSRDIFGGPADSSDVVPMLFLIGIPVMAAGTSWFFSSFVSQDTVAAGLAFFVTTFTITMTFVIWYRLNPTDDRVLYAILALLTWGLGLAAFIAGAIIALRRTTP